jgi:hypothetical protein
LDVAHLITGRVGGAFVAEADQKSSRWGGKELVAAARADRSTGHGSIFEPMLPHCFHASYDMIRPPSTLMVCPVM